VDELGVLVDGRLRHVGSAAELLGNPADPFVAEVAGANVLGGQAGPGREGLTLVRLDDERSVDSTDEARRQAALVIYPWDVSLSLSEPDDSA
jgi:ABC-type sulfate/molybdate transport systems ATPase subunit